MDFSYAAFPQHPLIDLVESYEPVQVLSLSPKRRRNQRQDGIGFSRSGAEK